MEEDQHMKFTERDKQYLTKAAKASGLIKAIHPLIFPPYEC